MRAHWIVPILGLLAMGCGSPGPTDAEFAAVVQRAKAAGVPLEAKEVPGPRTNAAEPAAPVLLDAKLAQEAAESSASRMEPAAGSLFRGDIDTTRQTILRQQSALERFRRASRYEMLNTRPRDWSVGFSVEPKELGAWRAGCSLLVTSAQVRAHDGDMDGAIEDLEAVRGLIMLLRHETSLYGDMLRVGNTNQFCRALMRIAERSQDPALIRRLADVIPESFGGVSLREILQNESFLGLSTLRRLGPGVDVEKAIGQGRAATIFELLVTDRAEDAMPTDARQRAYIAAHLAFWSAILEGIDSPEVQLNWDRHVDAALSQAEETPGADPAALRLLLPMLGRIPLIRRQPDAELRVTRNVLLAAAHRLETGQWPKELPVPNSIDPFTGDPLSMRTEPDLVVVWAYGQNLTDDGGPTWEEARRTNRGGLDVTGQFRVRQPEAQP